MLCTQNYLPVVRKTDRLLNSDEIYNPPPPKKKLSKFLVKLSNQLRDGKNTPKSQKNITKQNTWTITGSSDCSLVGRDILDPNRTILER